jgi:hypothetical protein
MNPPQSSLLKGSSLPNFVQHDENSDCPIREAFISLEFKVR